MKWQDELKKDLETFQKMKYLTDGTRKIIDKYALLPEVREYLFARLIDKPLINSFTDKDTNWNELAACIIGGSAGDKNRDYSHIYSSHQSLKQELSKLKSNESFDITTLLLMKINQEQLEYRIRVIGEAKEKEIQLTGGEMSPSFWQLDFDQSHYAILSTINREYIKKGQEHLNGQISSVLQKDISSISPDKPLVLSGINIYPDIKGDYNIQIALNGKLQQTIKLSEEDKQRYHRQNVTPVELALNYYNLRGKEERESILHYTKITTLPGGQPVIKCSFNGVEYPIERLSLSDYNKFINGTISTESLEDKYFPNAKENGREMSSTLKR